MPFNEKRKLKQAGAPNKEAPRKIWTNYGELLLFVKRGVNGSKFGPLFREVFESEDRGYRANWHACAAVDTFDGIDVEHRFGFVRGLVFARMDTVNGAHIHTGSILGVYTGFGNHVSHSESPW
jgi:hypothetical protein